MHTLVELDTCLSEKQKDKFIDWFTHIDAKLTLTKTIDEGLSCYRVTLADISNYDYTMVVCWEAANT